MAIVQSPRQNHLLAALPEAEWQRLLPHLEPVELPLGHVLYESGSTPRYVYFPTTAIVSLLYVMEDGSSAEIAIVGNEGVVGVALFMGGETTPSRAVVQSAGGGYRLPGRVLKAEFGRAGPVQHLLLRYTQALITQMGQTAVCNRHHTVEQQLCRWLLLSLDRLATNELTMTQELIANMLGVLREGVTASAGRLQDLGLINYRRGHITVLDRLGLERHACECYAGSSGSSTACCHRRSPPDGNGRVTTCLGLRPAKPSLTGSALSENDASGTRARRLSGRRKSPAQKISARITNRTMPARASRAMTTMKTTSMRSVSGLPGFSMWAFRVSVSAVPSLASAASSRASQCAFRQKSWRAFSWPRGYSSVPWAWGSPVGGWQKQLCQWSDVCRLAAWPGCNHNYRPSMRVIAPACLTGTKYWSGSEPSPRGGRHRRAAAAVT